MFLPLHASTRQRPPLQSAHARANATDVLVSQKCYILLHVAPFAETLLAWRLARAHWGKGYAHEAAAAAVAYAFDVIGLDELVAFTVPANARSRRVMERLGMNRNPAGDFEHPSLPAGHPLRPHVLYRLSCKDWQQRNGAL